MNWRATFSWELPATKFEVGDRVRFNITPTDAWENVREGMNSESDRAWFEALARKLVGALGTISLLHDEMVGREPEYGVEFDDSDVDEWSSGWTFPERELFNA